MLYTLKPGGILDLEFNIIDDENNEFTIEINLGNAKLFTQGNSNSKGGNRPSLINILAKHYRIGFFFNNRNKDTGNLQCKYMYRSINSYKIFHLTSKGC